MLRKIVRHPQPVKKYFARLVDEGASSPATTTPSRFHWNPLDSGREICKEAISLRKIGFFFGKIAPCATYTPPRTILQACLHSFLTYRGCRAKNVRHPEFIYIYTLHKGNGL